ncbi:hypothetical protein EV421DRAFT_1743383 [Armillaria borealis]|uniref:Xylulose 5-phosphate/Fructose 6-phosphate phosphoketolase C-terminal domain-containing protein n=1 Tax=Armillaria borealis TaxID=47425 RepID=A0AA39MES4_9AGAR|nr:hypothetical protein EV421DRAFT_1743383 [Armillaria borealis]
MIRNPYFEIIDNPVLSSTEKGIQSDLRMPPRCATVFSVGMAGVSSDVPTMSWHRIPMPGDSSKTYFNFMPTMFIVMPHVIPFWKTPTSTLLAEEVEAYIPEACTLGIPVVLIDSTCKWHAHIMKGRICLLQLTMMGVHGEAAGGGGGTRRCAIIMTVLSDEQEQLLESFKFLGPSTLQKMFDAIKMMVNTLVRAVKSRLPASSQWISSMNITWEIGKQLVINKIQRAVGQELSDWFLINRIDDKYWVNNIYEDGFMHLSYDDSPEYEWNKSIRSFNECKAEGFMETYNYISEPGIIISATRVVINSIDSEEQLSGFQLSPGEADHFTSVDNGVSPDVVLTSISVEVTFEVIATTALLHQYTNLHIHVVNVADWMIPSAHGSHPHDLTEKVFTHCLLRTGLFSSIIMDIL